VTDKTNTSIEIDGNRGTTARLIELDSLRGIAAMLVMLFHFTTRYDQLYGHADEPILSIPWGHYGVNLFFMISGFVIFMTLHRVRYPMDFVVSRFSRLFPAYWAAVAVTFLFTHAFELPNKTVSLPTAGMNLFMLHGLFRIPHVDGVYWTLEIELLFYALAFILYATKQLERIHTILMLLLGLRLSYFLANELLGIELSWTLSHLLLLPYIAWFALGIMIYRRIMMPTETAGKDWLVILSAIAQLGVVEGYGLALLAAFFTAILLSAAKGRLPILNNPVLIWLGTISYTLYLLHENIGWGVIRRAELHGLDPSIAIFAAICIALAIATVMTKFIEKPAMRWIRTSYKESTLQDVRPRTMAAAAGMLLACIAGLAFAWHKTTPPITQPPSALDTLYVPPPNQAMQCNLDTEPRPIMLMVLGQSNAGNHGEPLPPGTTTGATFFFEGKCYQTAGPAPGATGRSGNIWVLLGPKLERHTGRPVIFSVLAVDASSVRAWAKPGPLNDRLIATIQEQTRNGFIPDAILWQQGEADARTGTTQVGYERNFEALIKTLHTNGVVAPVHAALSTRCRNEGSKAVRTALTQIAARNFNIMIGPDTDELGSADRYDGCHFSFQGITSATELWAKSLRITTQPHQDSLGRQPH
jgi:peptidoglycan/LPS O-acetylase OafA/YrhL